MKLATIVAGVIGGFFLLRYLNREIDWKNFFSSIQRAKPAAEAN